jgi:hypothetical protein
VLADSGFPKSPGLVTCRAGANDNERRQRFRAQVTSCRVSAEHGNAAVKRMFPRLSIPLSCSAMKRKLLLNVIMKLYNFKIDLKKSNQISTRYRLSGEEEEEFSESEESDSDEESDRGESSEEDIDIMV